MSYTDIGSNMEIRYDLAQRFAFYFQTRNENRKFIKSAFIGFVGSSYN